MRIEPNKIVGFIHKTFSIGQNAVWKEPNYASLVATAASHNTYVETVCSELMPSADMLHRRIEQAEIAELLDTFLRITEKQLKNLKGRRALLILDYTCEPFFGRTQNDWIHGYRPVSGSRGCYKILSASIVVGKERYFIYAKPMNKISDETFEIWQIITHAKMLGIRIKTVLMDRGIARNSENIALFEDLNVKYLGLYQKCKNVKKIIKSMKRKHINRKFTVKGVPTRLVIGKDDKRKFAWVFVTNMKLDDFHKYLKLYKRRWNIETGFRVHDEAQIKTKSIDVRVRFFLFLAAMLLYNEWKSLGMSVPFKRFVIEKERGVEIWERKPT